MTTRPPSARKGGTLTGPNPVDRGKKGSKLHVLSDAQGIPLAVAVSGANLHDSQTFKPLILAIPAIRSRRGPRRRRPVKVRADKAYYSADHLAWLGSDGVVASVKDEPDVQVCGSIWARTVMVTLLWRHAPHRLAA